jgi:DNA polymerase elongation subunit (family B)
LTNQRRRLFLDIETSYLKVAVWDLYSKSNVRISHKNILPGGDPKIICACWKWAKRQKVESIEWNQRQNDKRIVKRLVQVMDSATEIVAHNGNRFDIPWIRGRAIYHRVPMRPTYPTLDTLRKSRQKFHFPSHRLDYLGNHLVGENKLPTEFDLWMAIVEDRCPKSMAKMVRYCKQDVRLLEKVFDRMSPYIEPITSVTRWPSYCPECGSANTIVHEERIRATGYTHVGFRCRDCGKNHTVPKSRFVRDRDRGPKGTGDA